MADPNNRYPDALQFIHSPVFVGIAVAFVSHALAMFGKHISAEIINNGVQEGLECVTLAASGYAAWKRWRAPIQPLTVTQAKADAVNSTQPEAVSAAPLDQQPGVKPP